MTDTALPPRPEPKPEVELERYWAGTAEGRLTLGSCTACGHSFFPPQLACPECWSTPTETTVAAGTGRVEAVSVVHRHGAAPFIARLPYAIAFVRLDEGLAFTTSVVNTDPNGVRIGDRVKVIFENTADGVAIPLVEPENS